MIAVDAYRPPYIPFHLTTVEFFRCVRDHLSDDGVVAINVGRTPTNFALVDALAATLRQVFPSVFVVDEPGRRTHWATRWSWPALQPVTLDQVRANAAALPAAMPEEFQRFAQQAVARARIAAPPVTAPVLTDDRSPIEQIVHGVIVDFLAGGVQNLPP